MAESDEADGAVLDDARQLGYAEADPSADIDGDDAGAKLVVLAGIAFRRHVQLPDIPRRSIRPISAADFRYARRLGCTIRQIAHGRDRRRRLPRVRRPGARAARLELRPEHGREQRRDASSASFGGESSFSGAGAGGPATAVAVVSDLLALTRARPRRERRVAARRARSHRRRAPYYLRFVVHDRPGHPGVDCGSAGQAGHQSRRGAAGAGLSERRAAVRHYGRGLRGGGAAGRRRRKSAARIFTPSRRWPCRCCGRAFVISFLFRVT